MHPMSLPVRRIRANAVLPEYATEGSAGMDLRACLDAPVVLAPLSRRAIPTGLAFAIPEGFEMQIRARSGLAARHGIMMVNGPGTIDSDYRGEVMVLLFNSGQDDFVVEPDMRIAQAVVAPVIQVGLRETDLLPETARGSGGLGSTGTR